MRLSNVRLILAREVRDQLRDRRTLFIIAVLPVVLYPLLGMSLFQIAQFTRQQQARVLVVGAGPLAGKGREAPASPPLFEGDRFAAWLFSDAKGAELLDLHFAPQSPGGPSDSDLRDDARAQVQIGRLRGGALLSPRFRRPARSVPQGHRPTAGSAAGQAAPRPRPRALAEVPIPEVIYSTASDKSQLACACLTEVLGRWTQRIFEENLVFSGVPAPAARPISIGVADVASPRRREGVMWSKILPVLLLLWALTGAFYPAIDLCAGEKERGTLETLLSSPAARSEIVLGKLVTIMLFSAVTAVLNLVSIGLTGWTILRGCRDSACRRRRRSSPWALPCCRWRRCSARSAWRWPPSPAAPRKANTI